MREQRVRLRALLPQSVVEEAFSFLDLNSLSVVALDHALAAELKIVLSRQNDVQIEMSSRLNKYGWTSGRILDHMLKVFYAKTQAVGRVLKAFLESQDPHRALEGYDGPLNIMDQGKEKESEEENVEIGKAYGKEASKFASGLQDLDID